MATQQEKDRAWARCRVADMAAKEELRTCQRQGRTTLRYKNLLVDARKLKAEYEKICRQPTSNPLSIKHGMKFQREKIIGDLTGRNGPDTHHGLGGNKSRPIGT